MTTEPTTYNWDQIRTAIDDGRITEAQGQQLWAEQTVRYASEQATAGAERAAQLQAVNAEIDHYTTVLPAVATEGSPEHGKVKAEFARLVKLGFPDALQTELAALQAVYGPPSALSRRADPEPEPQDDVGGGSADKPQTPAKDGPPSDFSADEKRYYEDLISRKVVASWAEAKELVEKYGSQRIRAKHR